MSYSRIKIKTKCEKTPISTEFLMIFTFVFKITLFISLGSREAQASGDHFFVSWLS